MIRVILDHRLWSRSNLIPSVSHLTDPWSKRGPGDPRNKVDLDHPKGNHFKTCLYGPLALFYLPISHYVYQSVCLPTCLPTCLAVCSSVCLSVSQSVSQSVSLSVCLSIYLSPLYTPHLLVHVCLEAVNQVISSFPCLCLWTYFQLTMLLSGNINVLMFF